MFFTSNFVYVLQGRLWMCCILAISSPGTFQWIEFSSSRLTSLHVICMVLFPFVEFCFHCSYFYIVCLENWWNGEQENILYQNLLETMKATVKGIFKSTAVQQALENVILSNIIVKFGYYPHACVGFLQGLWFPPTSQRCAIKWLACLLCCCSLSECGCVWVAVGRIPPCTLSCLKRFWPCPFPDHELK